MRTEISLDYALPVALVSCSEGSAHAGRKGAQICEPAAQAAWRTVPAPIPPPTDATETRRDGSIGIESVTEILDLKARPRPRPTRVK